MTLARGIALAVTLAGAVHLPVPIVRQQPERCGPASLAMVLRFYGGDSAAVAAAATAYDPVLRGALITELAKAAAAAGFSARVEQPDEDSVREDEVARHSDVAHDVLVHARHVTE